MPKKRAAKASAANDDEDWSKKTVAQLKKECVTRGLPVDGKKADLVQRLELDQDGNDEPPVKLQKESTLQKAMKVMKADAKLEKKVQQNRVVDALCNIGGNVYKDYDCMLNQTNIGNNNNKFYVIQLVDSGGDYYVWNRWGRVGEPGQNATKGPFDTVDDAIDEFKKKFSDKTKNAWGKRNNFKSVPGKYTMLDMAGTQEEPTTSMAVSPAAAVAGNKKTNACTLDAITQKLLKLIFDNDMFREALISMEIDVKKLPLGKLSKAQIVKGFEVLDAIQKCLDDGQSKKLTALSNDFYTVIPHSFGRQRPPVIADKDHLRKKLDMLLTLGDIEQAQDMLRASDEGESATHPLDRRYDTLRCQLTLLSHNDADYRVLEQYFEATREGYAKRIVHIWRVDRQAEGARFKAHDKLAHRKLLWHGTSVAVVAAILKSGLRIMPHSGGRVGRGIYFASENSKSAGYVGTSKKTGIMLLNEVALGKECEITQDDCSLTSAPAGFDSIVARGTQEPDPKKDTTIQLDGKKVVVPQGKPQPAKKKSSFGQSEYLVYRESQVRMRYLLELEFPY